jgi:hypothetical protein
LIGEIVLTHYGGFPAFEIMYDTGGHLVDPAAEQEAIAYFGTGDGKGLTDIIVMSHGWNNDIPEARALYAGYFASLRGNAAAIPAGRSFGVVALFWPSKRFADAGDIPGGAAGVTSAADAILSAQLDMFAELFAADPTSAAKIAHLRGLLAVLEHSQTAQDDYVAALVSLVPKPRYDADEGLDAARVALDTAAGHTVLQQMSAPVSPTASPPPLVPGAGGAASFGAAPASRGALVPGMGGAAGFSLGGIIGGIKAGAANLGDVLTYYTMKDRAAVVGRTGALTTVRNLRASRAPAPTIHLVAHSFGGRLVTALANALSGQGGDVVQTMSLLQAAYSHNGLAQNWDGKGNDGAFRSVITGRKVAGTILISHSVHDWPNGTAYPIASRTLNQVAAGFGGADDKYGAMGRNGAQHTPEAFDDTLHPVGTPYAPLTGGKWIRNLNGDGPPPPNAPTITAHGDIAKPEITWAFLQHL